uniref:Uncharacterized protein n=1 Tax=Molossus molossus TaxID=27622 RepID=A0A7J8GQ79_MOLMO|nr:hypothetical protein HJG59_011244 [Molossus molossus]
MDSWTEGLAGPIPAAEPAVEGQAGSLLVDPTAPQRLCHHLQLNPLHLEKRVTIPLPVPPILWGEAQGRRVLPGHSGRLNTGRPLVLVGGEASERRVVVKGEQGGAGGGGPENQAQGRGQQVLAAWGGDGGWAQ